MPARNLDLIRDILLRAEVFPLEEDDEFNSGYVDFLNQVSSEEAYQLILMRDAGMVEGKDAEFGLFRVTFLGHDYLDAVREEKVWRKTKQGLNAIGGGTLEIAKELAVAYIKQTAAEKLGIPL